nr:hypothetical transcript [Hymenolepis microstoma]CUU98600.1 hypothetical transcript [Hymenolepis microstoma]
MKVPSCFTLFKLLFALTYFGVVCVQSRVAENNFNAVEPPATENEELAMDFLEAMSTLSPDQSKLFRDMTRMIYLAIKKDITFSRSLHKRAYNFLRG